MADYAEKVASTISADVRMISGCHDAQTSADAKVATQFELPNPAGRSGGACTAALLEVLYKKDINVDTQDDTPQDEPQNESSESFQKVELSWIQVLHKMRESLKSKGFSQIPQLSSSRIIDVNETMTIVNNNSKDSSGTKRAVLIGINYRGMGIGQLSGCHNDVRHVRQYLINVHGFKPQDMIVLMDDGVSMSPTAENILNAFDRVVKESDSGDTVWIHYSGHGGSVPDQDGDEDDGYDETLIPLDFKEKGQIRDDDLLKYLVQPMKKGVTVTCLMDCCHSGTVLDLPYRYVADGDQSEMKLNSKLQRKGRWKRRFKQLLGYRCCKNQA